MHLRGSTRLFPALAVVALGASLHAQVFIDLGPGRANGVSADGTLVAGGGSGGQATGAWIWTQAGGQVAIGGSNAYGASGNGTYVLGAVNNGAGKEVAARWSQATGWVETVAPGWNGCDASLTNPYAISDDGNSIVGLGWPTCTTVAFRWTAGGGMSALPKINPGSARANGISGDGLTVGGWESGPGGGGRLAKAWFPDGSHSLLLVDPVLNPDGSGEVWGASTNGTWIVGQGASSTGAFRWSQATGVQHLGSLPVLGFPDAARAVTDDGSLIVGHSGSVFTGIAGFAWTPGGGMQKLADYLTARGVVLPPGITIAGASDMTADGTTIVGWSGANPFNERAFLVRLPIAPWTNLGQSLAGSGGAPALAGTGPLTAGSNTSLVLTNGKPNGLAGLFIGVSAINAPFKQGILVPFPNLFFGGLPLSASGAVSLQSTWPAGVPSGYSTWYQMWIADTSGPAGFTASNGLKATPP